MSKPNPLHVDSLIPEAGNLAAWREFSASKPQGVYVHVQPHDLEDIEKKYGSKLYALKSIFGVLVNTARQNKGQVFRTEHDARVHFKKPEQAMTFARQARDGLKTLPPFQGTHALSVSMGLGETPIRAEQAVLVAHKTKHKLGTKPGYAETQVYSMLPEELSKAENSDLKKSMDDLAKSVDDPEFQTWFQGSKILDPAGKPLMVFRGTRRPGNPAGYLGLQSYADSPDIASIYAGYPGNIMSSIRENRQARYLEGANVFPAYLSLKNPVDLTAHAGAKIGFGDILRTLRYGEPNGCTYPEAVRFLNYLINRKNGKVKAGDFNYSAWDTDGEPLEDQMWSLTHVHTPLHQIRDDFSEFPDPPSAEPPELTPGLRDHTLSIADRLDADAFAFVDAPRFKEVAQRLGHDGVIHHDIMGDSYAPKHLLGKDPRELQGSRYSSEGAIHRTYRPFDPVSQVRGPFEPMQKGSMARLAPFNPKEIPHYEAQDLNEWQHSDLEQMDFDPDLLEEGEDPEEYKQAVQERVWRQRDKLPRMSPEMKMRTLHRLAGRTPVRVNPETKVKEFLLHRGMGPEEFKASTNGADYYNRHSSSWTPDPQTATRFGRHLVSAWIPESHIVHAPYMAGDLEYGKGRNTYADEHEIIVAPSQGYEMANHPFRPAPPAGMRGPLISRSYVDLGEDNKLRIKKAEDPVQMPVSELLVNRRSLKQATFNTLDGQGSRTVGPLDVWKLQDGRHLLIDGHHRLVNHLVRGATSVPYKVIGEGYTDYYATPEPADVFRYVQSNKYGGLEDFADDSCLGSIEKAEELDLDDLEKISAPWTRARPESMPDISQVLPSKTPFRSGPSEFPDYTHHLPAEVQQHYNLLVSTRNTTDDRGRPFKMFRAGLWPKNSGPFAHFLASTPDRKRALAPVIEAEGDVDHKSNTIEPHIRQMTDRRAAGLTPYVLMAMIAHARNQHGIQAIRVPTHTPAAANVIRRLAPLAGIRPPNRGTIAKPDLLHGVPVDEYEGITEHTKRLHRGYKIPLFQKAEHIDELNQVGHELGGNPGGIYQDQSGQRFYVKLQQTNDHARNEVLATKLYQAAGLPTLDLQHLQLGNGRIGTASRWQEGIEEYDHHDPDATAAVGQTFGPHAWLANWDGVLAGNTGLTQGQPIVIDAGGSMLYRAMGEPKGKYFGDEVGEFHTLRDSGMNWKSAHVFGRMTPEQIRDSVARVASVSDEIIDQLVQQHGPGDEITKQALAQRLKSRRDNLVAKAEQETGLKIGPPAGIQTPVAKSEPLQKMAVIHESATRPMYVYRVQNKDGAGAYHGGLLMYLRDPSVLTQAYSPRTAPTPSDDFKGTDYERFAKPLVMGKEAAKKYKFAFLKPEDAVAWFGQRFLDEAKIHGYHLTKVPAQRVVLSHSKKQVMFLPMPPKGITGPK